MASTYIVQATQVICNNSAAVKSLIAIFNTAASGKILRVYKVWVENNQTTAVTGGNMVINLSRITAASGGITLTPVTFDTTNTVLGTVAAGTGMTVTTSDVFRRQYWSNDEPSLNNATVDEFQMFHTWSSLWDVGYGDANIEPIVCREGQGVSVQNTGTTFTTQYVDVFIEFTVT